MSEKKIILTQYQKTLANIVKQKQKDIERTKELLDKTFGSTQKAMEKLRAMTGSRDLATQTIAQIKASTESFQRVMESHQQEMATRLSSTRVRKQRFRRPELTKQLVDMLQKSTSKDRQVKTEILADGRKRTHILYNADAKGRGSDFQQWCWDNDILNPFGIVRHYKQKKSRYTPVSWDDLCDVLRTLNFTPKEVLEYSLGKIQTKERFLEHRIYRVIRESYNSALNDFIKIYKKHLKTGHAFQSFFYSKDLATWCASEDIFFKSEENCRIHKEKMVKTWNKIHPDDKVIDKKRKKN